MNTNNLEEVMQFLHDLNDGAFEILSNTEFEGKNVEFVDSHDGTFEKFLAGFWIDNEVEITEDIKKMIIGNNAKGLVELINSFEEDTITVTKGPFDIDPHGDDKGTIDINMGIFIRKGEVIEQ